MAKKKSFTISDKSLGVALIVALIIQYVLPNTGITMFSKIAPLIYLLVALYLIFLS